VKEEKDVNLENLQVKRAENREEVQEKLKCNDLNALLKNNKL
jgi:hypothetical protein